MDPFYSAFPVLLAPMAGYTDVAYRALCTSFGCDRTCTEMISAKGLSYGNLRTESYLQLGDDETNVAVQLFGHEPAVLADAARMVADVLGSRLACIDLNMGCPAQKVVANGDGSALMRTPALAGRIMHAVCTASPVPVTVKFRKGWEDDTACAFARIVQDNGAAALTIHARTRVQQYGGKADRACIAAVKAAVDIPVIGNGDVTDGASALAMQKETGCDGVMVGRGALGRPWIFAEIKSAIAGIPYTRPTERAQRALAYAHAVRILSEKGEHGLIELRKHMPFYLRGMHDAARLRVQVNQVESLEQLRFFLLDS